MLPLCNKGCRDVTVMLQGCRDVTVMLQGVP